MSDDLISRKALYDRVEKSMYENPHSDGKVRQVHNHEHAHFLCMIMQEPAAFNKEKVIDELRSPDNYTIVSGKHFTTVDRAIEIAEKGG